MGYALMPAGLQFERNGQSLFLVAIFQQHLDSGINVAFQAVQGRPYFLFDLQEFVDTHERLGPVSILDDSVWLFQNQYILVSIR